MPKSQETERFIFQYKRLESDDEFTNDKLTKLLDLVKIHGSDFDKIRQKIPALSIHEIKANINKIRNHRLKVDRKYREALNALDEYEIE